MCYSPIGELYLKYFLLSMRRRLGLSVEKYVLKEVWSNKRYVLNDLREVGINLPWFPVGGNSCGQKNQRRPKWQMNSITYLALFAAVSLYIRKEHMILDAKIIPNPLRGLIKNVKESFMSNPPRTSRIKK